MGKTQTRKTPAAKTNVATKKKQASTSGKKSVMETGNQSVKGNAAKVNSFIHTLEIENFKSIRSMKLKPKRVNVFIGEPNSGKTNILEALSLQSVAAIEQTFFKKIIRVKQGYELFHNQNTESPIRIDNNLYLSIFETKMNFDGSLSSYNYEYSLINYYQSQITGNTLSFDLSNISYERSTRFAKKNTQFQEKFDISSNILFYKYNDDIQFSLNYGTYLQPPYGSNLIHLLITNKELRESISSTLKAVNLSLRVVQHTNQIEIIDEVDGVSFVYTFSSLSETIRRQIFYSSILTSCKDNIILLDEPDTHSFPAYVKQFAEEIGINNDNQFFITTHNPYLLGSIIEKTPLKDLNIYVCRKKQGSTDAICLSKKQLDELTAMGVSSSFFNLDDFYPENA